MSEQLKDEIYRRRQWLLQENRKWPDHPVPVPADQWGPGEVRNRIAVWRSREFMIQIFLVAKGLIRMSVCRAFIDDRGRWCNDISWEDLQRLKNCCGFSGHDALEVYPAAGDERLGAEMRHLWILDEPVSFAWRSTPSTNNDENQTHEKIIRRF